MSRSEIEPITELGRQLEKERRNRGLTKEDWAEQLGTSKPTYNAWLRGQEPQLVNIRAVAETMGLTSMEVFGWIEGDRAKGVYRSSISRSPITGFAA
jgi:transcriptional regulator with XRE-family HTH domain